MPRLEDVKIPSRLQELLDKKPGAADGRGRGVAAAYPRSSTLGSDRRNVAQSATSYVGREGWNSLMLMQNSGRGVRKGGPGQPLVASHDLGQANVGAHGRDTSRTQPLPAHVRQQQEYEQYKRQQQGYQQQQPPPPPQQQQLWRDRPQMQGQGRGGWQAPQRPMSPQPVAYHPAAQSPYGSASSAAPPTGSFLGLASQRGSSQTPGWSDPEASGGQDDDLRAMRKSNTVGSSDARAMGMGLAGNPQQMQLWQQQSMQYELYQQRVMGRQPPPQQQQQQQMAAPGLPLSSPSFQQPHAAPPEARSRSAFQPRTPDVARARQGAQVAVAPAQLPLQAGPVPVPPAVGDGLLAGRPRSPALLPVGAGGLGGGEAGSQAQGPRRREGEQRAGGSGEAAAPAQRQKGGRAGPAAAAAAAPPASADLLCDAGEPGMQLGPAAPVEPPPVPSPLPQLALPVPSPVAMRQQPSAAPADPGDDPALTHSSTWPSQQGAPPFLQSRLGPAAPAAGAAAAPAPTASLPRVKSLSSRKTSTSAALAAAAAARAADKGPAADPGQGAAALDPASLLPAPSAVPSLVVSGRSQSGVPGSGPPGGAAGARALGVPFVARSNTVGHVGAAQGSPASLDRRPAAVPRAQSTGASSHSSGGSSNDDSGGKARQKAKAEEAKKNVPAMLPAPGALQVVRCEWCSQTLAVPPNLPPPRKGLQKLRCGKCLKVCRFLPYDPTQPPRPPPSSRAAEQAAQDSPPDGGEEAISPSADDSLVSSLQKKQQGKLRTQTAPRQVGKQIAPPWEGQTAPRLAPVQVKIVRTSRSGPTEGAFPAALPRSSSQPLQRGLSVDAKRKAAGADEPEPLSPTSTGASESMGEESSEIAAMKALGAARRTDATAAVAAAAAAAAAQNSRRSGRRLSKGSSGQKGEDSWTSRSSRSFGDGHSDGGSSGVQDHGVGNGGLEVSPRGNSKEGSDFSGDPDA